MSNPFDGLVLDEPPLSFTAESLVAAGRRRRSRRRTARAAAGLALATVGTVGAFAVLPTAGPTEPDTVTAGGRSVVEDGALRVTVCPGGPGTGGPAQLCGGTTDQDIVRALSEALNGAEPAGQECEAEPVQALTVTFGYEDEDRALSVDDCARVQASFVDLPVVRAPGFAVMAAELLRPAPPASSATGCDAVLAELRTLRAQAAGWPPLPEVGQVTVQRIQDRVVAEAPTFTPEQRRAAQDVSFAVNRLLLGAPQADQLLADATADLNAACPTR